MADNKQPPVIPDSYITNQGKRGIEIRDEQAKPRLAAAEPFTPGQNTLLSALLGLQAGTKAAAQTSQLQSPFVGLLAGLGASAQVPGQVEEMGIEKIGNRPVDEVSPILVQEFPELSGVPLSLVHKISPLLSRQADIKSKFAMLRERASQAHGRGDLSPQARKLLSEISGIPENELIGLSGIEAQRLGITPRALSGEQEKVYQNISQGANDLERALDLFDKVDTTTRKAAAVSGIKGKALRGVTMNEQAQELSRLVDNASDVLTRQRTGAALNNYEVDYYTGLLNDWRRSDGENRKALVDFLQFYRKVMSEIESGQRGSGTRVLQRERGRQENAASVAGPASQAKADPLGVRTAPKADPLGIRK